MNNYREHCIQQISTVVSTEKNVINIEKSIYNKTLSLATNYNIEKNWSNKTFQHIYKQKFVSIMLDLQNEDNNLIEKIETKEILSKNVALLSPEDILKAGTI